MAFATYVGRTAVVAAIIACGITTPGIAGMQRDATEPPLVPVPPLPLPPLPPSIPAPLTTTAPQPPWPHDRSAIGTVEMDSAGNIHLQLLAPARPAEQEASDPMPWPAPQERLGYGEIEVDRLNPHYGELLQHIGGLAHGQVKDVPPWRAGEEWHCALDPLRGPCPGLRPDAIPRR